ncbi:MAG: SDR family oxidoreductase [Acidimicrobiales bacterium]|nr:SDR family oxidoreductase [Acidimicrobiales bacterium]
MPEKGIFELTGEVALVTGGAAGMGRAIAARMGEAGAQVVVVDKDSETPAIVAKHLPGAAHVVADISLPHVHEDIVARAAQPFGVPTILVNDAGIYPSVAMLDATPEFFDLVYDTNLRGLAMMSVAFSRSVISAGRKGWIVNIASVDGLKPSLVSGLAPYAATKGAVIALTRHMAVELAEHGISVNGIAPGTVLTDGVVKGLGGGSEEAAREALAPLVAKNPTKRVADPDDIAKVAVFLASPAADYVRGQTIVVDGGWTLN